MFPIVPSSFEMNILPRMGQPSSFPPGVGQGVHFVMAADRLAWLLAKIEQWFANRDDVLLVASGITEKQQLGYILLEWDGEVDQLFLSILASEDMILDFTVYPCTEEE